MRTIGKCNNSHAPSTSLGGILLSVRIQLCVPVVELEIMSSKVNDIAVKEFVSLVEATNIRTYSRKKNKL